MLSATAVDVLIHLFSHLMRPFGSRPKVVGAAATHQVHGRGAGVVPAQMLSIRMQTADAVRHDSSNKPSNTPIGFRADIECESAAHQVHGRSAGVVPGPALLVRLVVRLVPRLDDAGVLCRGAPSAHVHVLLRRLRLQPDQAGLVKRALYWQSSNTSSLIRQGILRASSQHFTDGCSCVSRLLFYNTDIGSGSGQ